MINIADPIIGEEEKKAVLEVLESGMLAQGKKVKELESAFADYCGTKYAVALNSGTAAIHAAVFSLGVGPGDEVIVPPFTFVATANPVLMLGAKVVFADVREDDFMLDPSEVEKKITKNTKAIIPVDLYGNVHSVDEIKALANKSNLAVLSDSCQAIGAEFRGRRVGSLSDVSCFSLYATKNIISGEGGMVVTDSEEIAERCRRFRHHGQSEKTKYEYTDLGYNYRMTDLCAAVGVEQMKKIDRLTQKRIENAETFGSELFSVNGLVLPTVGRDVRHVFHQYTLRVTNEFPMSRDELAKFLKENGIDTGIYYPKPLHLYSHFSKLDYKKGDFPVAEKLAGEVLSLPVHPLVTKEDAKKIVKTIYPYV